MNMHFATIALLAQEGNPTAPQPTAPAGANILIFALPLALLFILTISSSRKQKAAQNALMAGMKKGDRVETSSGIIGTIYAIKDGEDELVVRSEDSKIRVRKSFITRVVPEDQPQVTVKAN